MDASPDPDPCPVNRFFYFRREVKLASLRGDLTLHVAADSNARIWINDRIVRRKVTRYFEPSITAETIDAREFVHLGLNTVVILVIQLGTDRHVSAKWMCSLRVLLFLPVG